MTNINEIFLGIHLRLPRDGYNFLRKKRDYLPSPEPERTRAPKD